jgi:carboxymethylenebutenolidase
VPNLRAALLLHYAEHDAGVNAGIEAYEKALKVNRKSYTIHMYPGAQHSFNNDTGAARYNKQAADLAWSRTVTFFKEHLGAARPA